MNGFDDREPKATPTAEGVEFAERYLAAGAEEREAMLAEHKVDGPVTREKPPYGLWDFRERLGGDSGRGLPAS